MSVNCCKRLPQTLPMPMRPSRFRSLASFALAAALLAALPLRPLPAAEAVANLPADTPATQTVDVDMAAQRALYVRAREALADEQTGEFDALREQLQHYPLLPYLDYAALSPQLATLAADGHDGAAVDAFLTQYRGSWLAQRLERGWLDALFNAGRWTDLVRYYNPENTTTVLTCQYLQARLETGDTEAFDDVAGVWNVTRSQPNICDPVFDAWLEAGLLSPEIAWQRFSKTLQAGHRNLARYISTLMPPSLQAQAELYLQVDRRPERLREQDNYAMQSPLIEEIVLHGLRRLARVDAQIAMELWDDYQRLHTFDEVEARNLERFIAMRQLLQGRVAETEALLTARPDLISEALAEWLLRDALKQQDWPRLERWLQRLPVNARASERWQYWQARALAERQTPEATTEAQLLYQGLAQTRSFYGFLAADLLELEYQLVDKPVDVADAQLQTLQELPAITRAKELWLVGDEFNAQGEWDHATASMAPEQILASGRLADSWGWYRNGIQAMIQASYWDDLQLRFPLAYSNIMIDAAQRHDMSPQFLFAIARQESAFMHDVRSSAGALGLMQLMPGTGQDMASGAGMRIDQGDLLEPDINIMLGSRYLAQMLQQFDGNRILAAAAYNAGPARVKQWLSPQTGKQLPLDIWIETIPFGETRGYIQNVLSYAVIYGYRMGDEVSLLTEAEMEDTF